MVFDHESEYASQWEAIRSIAAKIGCTGETLRTWARKTEIDTGRRAGITSDERVRLNEFDRENLELHRTNYSSRLHSPSIFLSLVAAFALLLGCGDKDPVSSGSPKPASPAAAKLTVSAYKAGGYRPVRLSREALIRSFDLQTLGAIPYPPDNPPRQKRIELGRLVFFDPILGGEKNVACGTCHHPDFAFADFRQFSAGTSGVGLGPDRVVSHSAITGNESGQSSHLGFQFLDGRVNGLEAQAIKPITSRVEMRGDAYPGTNQEAAAAALDSVIARLRSIPEYVQLFQRKRRWWKGLPSLIRRPTAGPLGPTSAS